MAKVLFEFPFPSGGFSNELESTMAPDQLLPSVSSVRVMDGFLECGADGSNYSVPDNETPNGSAYLHTEEGDTAAIMCTKDNVYRWGASSSSWEDISSQTFTGGEYDIWAKTGAANRIYLSNGVDGLYYYDGSGPLHTVTTDYKAKMMTSFAGRLFMAGVVDPKLYRNRSNGS